VFNGLHPGVYLAGRFGFFLTLQLFLAGGTTLLTGTLVTITHPWTVFAGFLLLGVIYGACGGLAGMMTREFLVAFLCVALLADIDAAWLQNPVYYSAGQNIEIIRWLPAFFPCQLIFAAGFTEDPNPAAAPGSLAYAGVVLCLLLAVVVIRLRRVRHPNRSPAPGVQDDLRSIRTGGTQ
jgi:hypothetical protein